MNEDELIKYLADPIFKQIEKMSNKQELSQLPQIEFIMEPGQEPIYIQGVQITEELIEKLKTYLQDEIEMICAPTILH